jgi:hypothetical protein
VRGGMLGTKVDYTASANYRLVRFDSPCAANVPVKCLMLASFLFEPSFKISSALNPCSLSRRQQRHSSHDHTQTSQGVSLCR